MRGISRTIREQVTDQIRSQVLAGELAPGQPLRELDFAERFGVSRGPVRDAFIQLAQEGVLAYQANRGVTVRESPDPDNRAFIVSLRQQIEVYVVRRGFDRLDDRARARLVQRLEECLEELRAACDRQLAAEVGRADLAFHEALLLGCGGESFLPVWRWLCLQMLFAYTRLETYDAVHAEHQAILDAIQTGKRAAVSAALKANIQ